MRYLVEEYDRDQQTLDQIHAQMNAWEVQARAAYESWLESIASAMADDPNPPIVY